MQLCVVLGYSRGWQAGLENIREEDLIICCTKSRSITQAGSELDFLLRPKATADRDRHMCYSTRSFLSLCPNTLRLTNIPISQNPVDELTEDLSGLLHRLLVLRGACTATTTPERGYFVLFEETNHGGRGACNILLIITLFLLTHLASS